jgi:hypothetical protein
MGVDCCGTERWRLGERKGLCRLMSDKWTDNSATWSTLACCICDRLVDARP